MASEWEFGIPSVGTEAAGTGQVGFVYEFSAEEITMLEVHGFERSQISPATQWFKYCDPATVSGAISRIAARVFITPFGLEFTSWGKDGKGSATTTTGMDLIPLLVRALIAEEL